MTMPQNAVERLAMNLGLATYLIQTGTPLSIVKQQMVPLIAAAKAVLTEDDIPDDVVIQVSALLPTEVADALAEDTVVPDDLSGFDDGGI